MTKEKVNLTWRDIDLAAREAATRMPPGIHFKAYGIPRGGIYAALAMNTYKSLPLVEDPREANVFIDDLVDSGATRDRYAKEFPGVPFVTLFNKPDKWLVFPWEAAVKEEGIEDNVVRILQYIGEDPNREGLQDTPSRVVKAYGEMFSGYRQTPSDLITSFEDGACDEMVLLKNIEFSSYCEHHMLPFRGHAHIAYIPDGRVIGISKLARLLDMYASRLQIQERIGQQVTVALDTHLKPLGSACIIEAHHQCMSCRGVRKQNSVMVSSSLSGVFMSKPEARAELMALIR